MLYFWKAQGPRDIKNDILSNTQIQSIKKCQKYPTYALFLNMWKTIIPSVPNFPRSDCDPRLWWFLKHILDILLLLPLEDSGETFLQPPVCSLTPKKPNDPQISILRTIFRDPWQKNAIRLVWTYSHNQKRIKSSKSGNAFSQIVVSASTSISLKD